MKERREGGVTAVFAGSFDPFTKGHAQIASDALSLFGHLVIAVGYNEHKRGLLSADERVAAIRSVYADDARVEVIKYSGLTVQLAERYGEICLVRGVRSSADFEYERSLADTNRAIAGVRTVMLPTVPELGYVSSSMVRELLHNGYDPSAWLPEAVAAAVKNTDKI